MRVELIAIGSELLDPLRRDTNGDWLVNRLEAHGLTLVARTLVGDDPSAIAASIRTACVRSDLLIATGGLGPTADDRTREGIAAACGASLQPDPSESARIERRMSRHGHPFSAAQARQAQLPGGAKWIVNPVGTASGIRIRSSSCLIFALPGVPSEMRAMFTDGVLPQLPAGPVARRCLLRTAGSSESAVDARLEEFHGKPGLRVTTLLGREGVEVHLTASDGAGEDRLLAAADRMAACLGDDLYSRDGTCLAAVVGRALAEAGATVATAESCTAGELAAELTATPGSSSWFRGGFVVYDDELKQSLVGVNAESLERDGAVSEAVARELAQGARLRCGTDYGIGVTGIAGPGGGSRDKPVGLVHIALARAGRTQHWQLQQFGDRSAVRRRSVVFAIDRLRRDIRAGAGGRESGEHD